MVLADRFEDVPFELERNIDTVVDAGEHITATIGNGGVATTWILR